MSSAVPPNPGAPLAPGETLSYEPVRARGDRPDSSAPIGLARGLALQRYVVLDRIGEGGMGVVYAAYDSSLDRRVALKFLRPQEADRRGVRERRLLREAQAMARLSHPNVAVVYEVGTFRGQVFLAMEFVDGVDLREWLAEKPRSFAEILEIFRAAGRGLAAAHASDIVHRDFKPENVLLDRQGRPRVTDFGLSRTSYDPEDDETDSTADHHASALSSPSHLSAPLTGTGGLLGTPFYMAPEQHLGGAVDARSDQYSFCVAAHEAFYGEHPFGEDPASRRDSAIAGRVAPAPAKSEVPRWCRQALLRGLAPARESRFDSMDALLGALAPRPMSSRRQVALAALLGVALTGAGGYLAVGRSTAGPSPRCNSGAERLVGVWDAARKQQLREAFERTGARAAEATWRGFSAILDERAGKWAAMYDEACAATHVRGVQSPAVLDLRVECLDRRGQEMKALVAIYADAPEASSLDRAVSAADGLPSVAACADVPNLRAVVPLPDDVATRARIGSIRERLSHSRALHEAGRYAQGRQYTASLKHEADAIGYAPLAAEAANALASHLSLLGEHKEAEALLLDAAKRAVEGRDWAQEAEAWLELVGNYGRDGRVPEGLLAARVAELAVRRANGDESVQARLARNVAYGVGLTGNLQEELQHYRRAEKLWKRTVGASSPRYAYILNQVGSTLINLGRPAEGLTYLERSLALQRSILRPDHPEIAETLHGMGLAYRRLGDIHRAREFADMSAQICKRELGPANLLTIRALELVAGIDSSLGNYDRALETLSNLLAVQERVLDPHDVRLASAYALLAGTHWRAGHVDKAERMARQAIEQEKRAGTPDNLVTAHSLSLLGDIHNHRGMHRQAHRECRHALDILSRKLGEQSSRLLGARRCLGEALIAAGDFEAARKELERGLASSTPTADGTENIRDTAPTRFQLARALWGTPADRPRARDLARTTLVELAAAEGDNRKLMERIDAWLSANQSHP